MAEYWDADGITVKGLNYVDALKIGSNKIDALEKGKKFM
jgi:hypothetical protein